VVDYKGVEIMNQFKKNKKSIRTDPSNTQVVLDYPGDT